MKIFIRVILVTIAFVLLAMFSIPFLFKGKIEKIAKEQANSHLNATFDFESVKLSLFKDFPNLSVELRNVVIVGKGTFANDTLASIKNMGAGLNIISAISNGPIKTSAIYIKNAKFNTIINESKKVNWDILKDNSHTENTDKNDVEVADSEIPEVQFDNIFFHNIDISFDDRIEKTLFLAKGINIELNGNFSEKNTNIDFSLNSPNTNLKYGEINYLKNTKFIFKAIIGANLNENKYTFKENKLKINNLEMNIKGECEYNENELLVNLKLNSLNNEFKSILSLIPGEFQKDIENIKTSGKLSLEAWTKGSYKFNEEHFPAFDIKLAVDNANLKYEELSESIDDISINAKLYSEGGKLDNMITDISKFHFEIAKNPFDFNMTVKTPMTDPALNGQVKGIIDFAKLKNAIPMDDISISGIINADVIFNGNMSYIENNEYEKFTSKGNISLKNFKFVNKELPKALEIKQSLLTFSSKQISLTTFNAYMGNSDFSLKGTIKNFFPYIFKNSTLVGDFHLNSNKLDINEMMTGIATGQEKIEENQDTSSITTAIEIPKDLKLSLNTSIKTILYDKLTINNTGGNIKIEDGKANLKNLKMYMLKGDVNMNGIYDTSIKKNPSMNIAFNINNFDLHSAWDSFTIIKNTIPIAMNAAGKISMDFELSSKLNPQMELIPSTIKGKGLLSSRNIIINDNKMLNTLATVAKDNSLKRVSISKMDINFDINEGNLQIKPFTTKIAGYPTTIFGNQSVDGKIDYTVSSKVDKKILGDSFKNIPGFDKIKTLDVEVNIGGTLDNPSAIPNIKKIAKQIEKAAKDELKNKAKKELINGLNKFFK